MFITTAGLETFVATCANCFLHTRTSAVEKKGTVAGKTVRDNDNFNRTAIKFCVTRSRSKRMN